MRGTMGRFPAVHGPWDISMGACDTPGAISCGHLRWALLLEHGSRHCQVGGVRVTVVGTRRKGAGVRITSPCAEQRVRPKNWNVQNSGWDAMLGEGGWGSSEGRGALDCPTVQGGLRFRANETERRELLLSPASAHPLLPRIELPPLMPANLQLNFSLPSLDSGADHLPMVPIPRLAVSWWKGEDG